MLEKRQASGMSAASYPRPERVCPRLLPGLTGVLASWILVGQASGWEDCTISPADEWSFEAASYYFDSPCTGDGFFYPDRILSCLEGRRVVFLGDSLSIQQADSLVGMLGWHPYWIESTNPYNGGKGDEEGKPYRLEVRDCWREPYEKATGLELCWDLYEREFPAAPALGLEGENGNTPAEPLVEAWAGEEASGRNETSVHARDYSFAVGKNWFSKAINDFNETRASDVFVINFGAHYHETPEGNRDFKDAVLPILDEMAEVGKTATVVWREISPIHFPSPNATWEDFDALDPEEKRGACCTGTPPRLLTRNQWVEDYLVENGLTDTVKLLRIYEMSLPRASAHHTCHIAPPSTMDQGTEATSGPVCNLHSKMDCRHWSATGVVEEWNALLLHHLCPAD